MNSEENSPSTLTLEMPVEAVPAPSAQPKPAGAPFKGDILWATGRRKTATAQVRLVQNKNGGKVSVNGKSVEDYFKGNLLQKATALQSYQLAKNSHQFDLIVRVTGGGITGQAEAVRYGIARALLQYDPQLKLQLRKAGFLSRDPRMVERKKSGQPKARKRFQYSKR